MKVSLLALPVVAVSLVLGGCSGHHRHGHDTSYDRSHTQSPPPPPPAGVPDNNSNTPAPQYPATGGSR
ncbi:MULTISPECIES: hypothetical protein [Bordetella]|uniref:hypothetical protein n=1 Tax=Bordetella TaxID=517 RepID=UPI0004BB6DB1|nr:MULTISPECIES: hypothetical protein [Bordetella]